MYIKKKHLPYIFYLLLATIVLGEGLRPGYLFLLDMPWPETFSLSNYTAGGLQPHMPFTVLFSLLNIFMPAWVIQKMVLLGVLSGAGASVYMLSNYIQKNARSGPPVYVQRMTALAAGVMAILNPYVAERLLAGQWLVLAGYAYAPIVLLLFLKLIKRPCKHFFWQFAVAYALFPIISIHWWYITTPILLVAALFQYLKNNQRYNVGREQFIKAAGAFAAIFLVVNAFWIPAIAGSDGRLSAISNRDFEVFQTVPDQQYGLEVNVVSLYGFWSDHLQTPKDFNSLWIIYGIGTFALAVAGAVILTRRRSVSAATLLSVLPLTIVIALGYGHAIGNDVIGVLQSIPGFSGLRDTAKIVGVIALFVALFTPYTITSLYNWRVRVSLGGLLLVVVIFMNGMLFGARGQLIPHQYPDSYRQANLELQKIDQPALVLPWKGYLNLNFADNRYVANPANSYFATTTRTSKITGNGLLDGKPDPFEYQVLKPYDQSWSQAVIAEGYNYIVLLKTDSWRNYQQLLVDHNVIFDSEEIAVIEL